MKKIGLVSMMVALVAFASCNQDELPAVGLDIDSEATVDVLMEDIDVLSEAALDLNVSSNGRSERAGDDELGCASVEKDTVSQTITIDFGDGCESPSGKVRSGKILISYDGRRFEAGSFRSVTFENFFIDSTQIAGTRTVTNITEEGADHIAFNATLVGGLITFADGSSISREANKVRRWYRETIPTDDYATVSGTASGFNREGVTYSSEITEELLYQRSCGRLAKFPVSGIKIINIGEEEIIMDFGDGSCDNIVAITKDGETFEEELEYNPRRPKKRNLGRN